jgi:hypothetical protein
MKPLQTYKAIDGTAQLTQEWWIGLHPALCRLQQVEPSDSRVPHLNPLQHCWGSGSGACWRITFKG